MISNDLYDKHQTNCQNRTLWLTQNKIELKAQIHRNEDGKMGDVELESIVNFLFLTSQEKSEKNIRDFFLSIAQLHLRSCPESSTNMFLSPATSGCTYDL